MQRQIRRAILAAMQYEVQSTPSAQSEDPGAQSEGQGVEWEGGRVRAYLVAVRDEVRALLDDLAPLNPSLNVETAELDKVVQC